MIKNILCDESHLMLIVYQIVLIVLKIKNVICGEWWIVFFPTYVTIASIVLSIILMLYVKNRTDKF